MDRNRLDPDEQQSQLAQLLAGGEAAPDISSGAWQNPLASSNFKQFEWAKEHPQVAGSLAQLLQYLSMLPMGRSVKGARIGDDNVMAGKLDRRAGRIDSRDVGITGGADPNITMPNSTEALMGNDAILPATRDLAPYYPTRRDYPTAANEPGRPPGQMDPFEIYQDAQHAQKQGLTLDQWRASVDARKTNRFLDALQGKPPARERLPFDVIPGGKKD